MKSNLAKLFKMEVQNSTSTLGRYWNFLFTELAGLLINSGMSSDEIMDHFCFVFRPSDKRLAFNRITPEADNDHSTLPVFRQHRGTSLHEGSQAIPNEKHIDCLQLLTSAG